MLQRTPDFSERRTPRNDIRSDGGAQPIDLGHEPPLDPTGVSTPRGERRGISVRWLTGSILTGLSGAALIGAAIYVSLQGDTTFAELPEAVSAQAPKSASGVERPVASTRKADRLVKSEPVLAARQAFKAPVTLRVGQREVIKVRPFVRIATGLSLTSGQYATDIPPFNPLKLFAEGTDAPERFAEAPADTNDADVSFIKSDLATVVFPDPAPGLSDDEVAAQIEEERRLAAEAGRRPALPLPAQLMLSRTLRQPGETSGPLAYASPVETSFSAIEVRVVPENVSVQPKSGGPAPEAVIEEKLFVLKKGETLEQILKANGATPEQTRSMLTALSAKVRILTLGEGQRIKLLIAPGPKPGDKRQIVRAMLVSETAVEAIAAVNDRGVFVSVAPPEAEDKAVTGKPSRDDEEDEEDSGSGVRLYESLYETALKNEIPRSVVDDLIRIFAYDVDFQRRVSGGDTFEVFYSEDEEGAPGRVDVLYASLTIAGEKRRIYRYQAEDDGSLDYLDQDGRSLKKFLVRKPIAEAELRSGFGMRYHPVLRYSKLHTGVDWANRIGTPIIAAGNGTVIKAEWDSGYGRRIEIQHANGYLTTYSHQSAFARGVVPGVRVRQGQVIGYLGNTGLSTGPHLHYEVLVNGHFVNPMKIKVPRGRELDGRALVDFRRQREQVDTLLIRASGTQVAQREK